MVLGMSIASFTLLHVVLSLIGIASGLVVWPVCGREKARRLDRAVSGHDRGHQRDRIPVSLRKFRTAARDRPDLAAAAGAGDSRALLLSPRRIVALDLHRHRDAGAVFQCVRRRGAGFPEAAAAAAAGADRHRAAVRHRPGAGAAGFYRVHRAGAEALLPGPGQRGRQYAAARKAARQSRLTARRPRAARRTGRRQTAPRRAARTPAA